MRRLNSSIFLASAVALVLAGCGDDDSTGDDDIGDDDDAGDDDSSVVEVTDAISASETWTADKTYILKDHIFVTGCLLIRFGVARRLRIQLHHIRDFHSGRRP